MASIVGTKREKDHFILKLKLSFTELDKLKGKVDRIHLLSEDNITTESSLYQRGKKGCTKYFLIPKCLRKNVKFNHMVSCSKLNHIDKTIWVFLTDNF